MKKLTLLLACFFISMGFAIAQTKTIKGIVVDEAGEPIIGASVIAKGTDAGTVTGMDGDFSLNIPASVKTLLIKYIGMVDKEVPASDNMRISLSSDSKILDEVVVTALGIKRSEKALGYSATTVNASELTATSDRSALNALQGKVAGVNINSSSGAPGSSTRIVIRGISTLSGSTEPLYVIDGVPVNNSVVEGLNADGTKNYLNGGADFGNRANDINPDDIENLTVLKGSAATALYGSRAAKGVIMITTKKGKNTHGKGKIDIASSVTFDTPLRLPIMQNEFGQGWYNQSLDDLRENGSWGPKFDDKMRVWGNVANNQQRIKPYSALETNVKDFFDVGVTYNNSISFTNGNDKLNYYLSYSNVSSDGIMPSDMDSYKRNTFAMRGSAEIFTGFTANASMNYVRKDSKYVITGQEQSVMDGVWQTPRDISLVEQKDYKNNIFNTADYYFSPFTQNPYYLVNENGTDLGEDRVFGNISFDYKPFKYLTFTGRLGGDYSNTIQKGWTSIYTAPGHYNDIPGQVQEVTYRNGETTGDFITTYNNSFGEFDLMAVAGYNFNQREANRLITQVIGLDIPGFYNLSNSSSTPTVNEQSNLRRTHGVYGSAELSWRKMLYLTVIGRNDWSSTLPSQNQSYFYPGANVSFLFSELIENKDILSFGKVRVGLAQTGNDADPYLTQNYYKKAVLTDGYRNLNFPLAGSLNGFTLDNVRGNNNLKAELTTEFEVGLDLRFLQDRIGLDFAYYNKSTNDLIWKSDVAPSSGYTLQTVNLGEISNKGIEALLTVVPVRNKDWEWKLAFNFTKNKNRLEKLADNLDQISFGGTSSMPYVGRPGEPLALYQGPVPLMHEGHIVVNNRGLPIAASAPGIYATSEIDFQTGLTSTLSWKNFTMLVTCDYRKGGYMYSRTAELLMWNGNSPVTTFNDRQPFIIPNSVVQDKDGNYVENTTPIAGYDHNMNEYYNQTYGGGMFNKGALIDKTFFKLRELSLAYNVPQRFLKKTKVVSNLNVAAYARNFFMWTPDGNLYTDPESTTFGIGIESNYGEYGATPSTKSFGVSLKVGF